MVARRIRPFGWGVTTLVIVSAVLGTDVVPVGDSCAFFRCLGNVGSLLLLGFLPFGQGVGGAQSTGLWDRG